MLKKFLSILMLYSALVIMLGHNLIGHHHHDFEQNLVSHHFNGHHHFDGHDHHSGHDHHNDTEDESNDWRHFFSNLQHGVEGLTFLISHSSIHTYSKQIPKFSALLVSNFVFQQRIIEVRQNAPPHFTPDYISQNFPPTGLRGPPIFIV